MIISESHLGSLIRPQPHSYPDKTLINCTSHGTLEVAGGLITTYKLDLSHATWDANNIQLSIGPMYLEGTLMLGQ